MLLKVFTLYGDYGGLVNTGLSSTERFYQSDSFSKITHEHYSKGELASFTGKDKEGKEYTVYINFVFEGYELLSDDGCVVKKEVYPDLHPKSQRLYEEDLKTKEVYKERHVSKYSHGTTKDDRWQCVKTYKTFVDLLNEESIMQDFVVRDLLNDPNYMNIRDIEESWGQFKPFGDKHSTKSTIFRPLTCMEAVSSSSNE